MMFEKPVAELIKARSSWRKYSTGELSPELKDRISTWIAGVPAGPFQSDLDFHFIEKNNPGNKEKIKLGTYGFISGARYFVAGAMDKEKARFEDYGYLLEKIILFLTGLDLGTCWLGGTFNREDFARHFELKENKIIPAVTPVGYPTERRGLRDRLIRRGAGSQNRKPWEELFFLNDFSQPISREQAGEYCDPLEMVRLGPSASNKQPCRILSREGSFDFFLARTKNYEKMSRDADLQRIDMGIAMCHFELTARESNLQGTWQVKDNPMVMGDLDYIVSWVRPNN